MAKANSGGSSGGPSAATLLAGAAAGILSDAITHPVSTAKARLQVQRVAAGAEPLYRNTSDAFAKIIRTEGWPKLYAGFGTVVVAAPARALYFGGDSLFCVFD